MSGANSLCLCVANGLCSPLLQIEQPSSHSPSLSVRSPEAPVCALKHRQTQTDTDRHRQTHADIAPGITNLEKQASHLNVAQGGNTALQRALALRVRPGEHLTDCLPACLTACLNTWPSTRHGRASLAGFAPEDIILNAVGAACLETQALFSCAPSLRLGGRKIIVAAAAA